MGSEVAGGGYTFKKISVGGTWFWTIRADNVQGSNQLYFLEKILTPFGKLTDGVDVPIPGDVVYEMAHSLAQFQQQLAPLLQLQTGAQTIFNVTVTQNDPMSEIGTVAFFNAGAFGSFMTATATPNVAWLTTSPASVPGLNKNEYGQFVLTINPATLLSADSPYSGVVNLQDNRATPTLIPIVVNVTVLPQPTILATPTNIGFSWTLATGYNSGSAQLTVTNSGPATSILNFTVAKAQNSSPWLAFSPQGGGPLASGVSSIITLSLLPYGIPQVPGTYTDTLVVSAQNATNCSVSILVCLTVS